MAYSYNRVILVGNLTRDPELRYTNSQLAVSEVGLAVNDRRKNAQGEWVDEVTFVDVTLWGRTAEVACEYLKKGASVMFEGRLKLDTWESQDGQKRSKLRVVAEKMLMLGGKAGGGGGGGGGPRSGSAGPGYDESEFSPPADYDAPRPAGRAAPAAPPDDDIPF